MKRLLWIGDAACDSGFAKCTHATLEAMRNDYEVTVLGLNYRGDPHPYPYPLYPAWAGGDLFGIGRVKELFEKVRPHVVVIQNDPWNVPHYMQAIDKITSVPRPVLIGAMAVDGKNCRGWAMNGLDHVIFWTRYGQYEAVKGGYKKSSSIVPLGVDLDLFVPGDRVAARKKLGLPESTLDGFFLLNVNRNQPRKRLDLSVKYFAEWIKECDVRDAFLYLHVAPTGDLGYDCDQLAGYYGLHGRIILAEPGVFHGPTDEMLVSTYQAADIQCNTGVGEGWGLTTMEGMACGLPQVVGNWAALGEWAVPAAVAVHCEPVASLNKVNVIGGEPNKNEMVDAFDRLYRDRIFYEAHRAMGYETVRRPEYRWATIASQFLADVNAAVEANG